MFFVVWPSEQSPDLRLGSRGRSHHTTCDDAAHSLGISCVDLDLTLQSSVSVDTTFHTTLQYQHNMPVAPGPSRRFVVILIGVSFCLCFAFVASFRNQAQGVRHPLAHGSGRTGTGGITPASPIDIQPGTLSGHVIAPKLGNETAKYALSLLNPYFRTKD